MSLLAPLYLLLGAAALVPLLIHLLRRRIGTRIDFPAARYLARAEQEHSRSLRLRNILLMLLRVAIVLFVASAAARPVIRLAGAGHGPTALAIVLDNSLSTTVVVDGHPLFEQFRGTAREIFAAANATDRLWLITADGRVRGGGKATLREELDRVEALGGAGNLPLALAHAGAAVRSGGLDSRQIDNHPAGCWKHVRDNVGQSARLNSDYDAPLRVQYDRTAGLRFQTQSESFLPGRRGNGDPRTLNAS